MWKDGKIYLHLSNSHCASWLVDDRNQTISISEFKNDGGHNWNDIIESLNPNGLAKKATVIANFGGISLLPTEVYSPKHAQEQYRLENPVNEDSKILTDNLKRESYALLYQIPKSLEETLGFKFSKVDYASAASGLINEWSGIARDKNPLFLFSDGNDHLLASFEKGRLGDIQTFKAEHQNDVLYFVLNTINIKKRSTKETSLFLGGSSNDKTKSFLETYIQEVTYCPSPQRLFISGEMKQLPLHQYFHLFACQ